MCACVRACVYTTGLTLEYLNELIIPLFKKKYWHVIHQKIFVDTKAHVVYCYLFLKWVTLTLDTFSIVRLKNQNGNILDYKN